MARQRIAKDLPPLDEIFTSFSGFDTGRSRQRSLTALLKGCAEKLQLDEPRPFYSMREVAQYFHVPLRTVALAYETLDLEGMLHRIRGSQTLLAGKQISTRNPVNAVIGLPIWLQAMITSPFECNLQMALEERLRARGFVADSIFYRSNEDYEPDFAERLLRHNLDIVIWQSPHPLASHVLMSLRERGVRLVLIQSSESPINIPSRHHLLDWREAYADMAQHWAKRGIRTAVVPQPENLISRRALKRLKPILNQFDIETLEIEATESGLSQTFVDQEKEGSVLAFMDFQHADFLCNGYPELIEKISESSRLAFCRGPVRIPRLATKRICVDVVELDPSALAKVVVEDLCDPNQKQEGPRGKLHAQYKSQIIMGGMNDGD